MFVRGSIFPSVLIRCGIAVVYLPGSGKDIRHIHTHTPSVGDSLRRRDVTKWFKMRQYPDLTCLKNDCRSQYTHLVFYFYCELSEKEGEKARRAEEAIGIINVMAIAEEIPIPQQIQKFWASSKNKEIIQQFLLVK